jgi:hypothetical protein
MITSDAGLTLAQEELCRMSSALQAIHAEHPEATPRWRAIMGEGFLDEARRLTREIEDYLGAKEIDNANGQPLTADQHVPKHGDPG